MRIKTRMARGYRAIRLLGMEKKKKEKDGEAIKKNALQILLTILKYHLYLNATLNSLNLTG